MSATKHGGFRRGVQGLTAGILTSAVGNPQENGAPDRNRSGRWANAVNTPGSSDTLFVPANVRTTILLGRCRLYLVVFSWIRVEYATAGQLWAEGASINPVAK
jgi:hypothetical protein